MFERDYRQTLLLKLLSKMEMNNTGFAAALKTINVKVHAGKDF